MVVGAVSGIGGEVSGVAFGMALVTWFVMSWLYGSCCEAFWHGQTPGKRMLNLRVVRSNGTPIGWFEAFGRNLLLFADGMLPVWILPLLYRRTTFDGPDKTYAAAWGSGL